MARLFCYLSVLVWCVDGLENFNRKVFERGKVVAVEILDDERGLIAFEISVGERELFGRGGDEGFEAEDGDGIVFGNGCGDDAAAFFSSPDLEA